MFTSSLLTWRRCHGDIANLRMGKESFGSSLNDLGKEGSSQLGVLCFLLIFVNNTGYQKEKQQNSRTKSHC